MRRRVMLTGNISSRVQDSPAISIVHSLLLVFAHPLFLRGLSFQSSIKKRGCSMIRYEMMMDNTKAYIQLFCAGHVYMIPNIHTHTHTSNVVLPDIMERKQ